jgi:hypothetical protein
MIQKAFFAYPAEPSSIGTTIADAIRQLNGGDRLEVTPWQALPIVGLKLDRLIRDRIAEGDFLVADITFPNFNVYYEIGYCFGSKKPVIPTVNRAYTTSTGNVNLTGIFDTIGQLRYENAGELAERLQAHQLQDHISNLFQPKDHSQPLFMLDTLRKIDFRNWILQSISNSSVNVRRFDPDETPRLSLYTGIVGITASTGVIIPLLAEAIDDSLRHNLRASFLAGLSHGYGLEPLITQYEDLPAPIDFRDFIDTSRTRKEVAQVIEEYCAEVLIKNQQRGSLLPTSKRPLLERVDLGSSAAEAEYKRLSLYFVRTAEFSRAMRSPGALVVGRKGSGKSAIFYQAFSETAKDKRNLIVDLSPASHNLSELREELLKVVAVGVFDHTIAAFWQYILYAEILLKLRETLLPKARYNLTLLNQIKELEEAYGLTDEMVEGDFTARLAQAVRLVINGLEGARGADYRSHLTNLLFESHIPSLRENIVELGSDFKKILLLFDNLDKGWPARKIEPHDIRMIQHLIAVLNKIQRELGRKSSEFQFMLFLRSDVYEQLVEETADRGKHNLITVDWSDREQLVHLINQRVISNFQSEEQASVWKIVNPLFGDRRDAMSHMLDSSLMRPRFLIDLCERAISFAINRGHEQVTAKDVEDALEQHSIYLVSFFGYELRDVSGISDKIFYNFIGQGVRLTEKEMEPILARSQNGVAPKEVIMMLLWYGFLGIPDASGNPVYIYDRAYDMRRLEAELERQGPEVRYFVNGAFLRGLEC